MIAETKIIGDIYLYGDLHWNWKRFFWDINEKNISSCTIICVGDIGFGFDNCGEKEATTINLKLKEKNIIFLSIRGNHDCPRFFDGETINLSNLKMIPDYSYLDVNGENWLLIGGGD